MFIDFQLMVGQAQGEYEAWSPTMVGYLKKVQGMLHSFDVIDFQ